MAQKLKASKSAAWRFLSGKDVRRRKEATLLRARNILREVVDTKRKELKKNEMRQDPADPDNWGVGSLNRERAMYPAHHTVLNERGAKEAAKKTVKVKTAAMLTAEAEAVKHLVEPSDFFKEQFGRENRFGATGQESIRCLLYTSPSPRDS